MIFLDACIIWGLSDFLIEKMDYEAIKCCGSCI